MIENYLDFAKRKRIHALRKARGYLEQSRNTNYEWCKGFYRGLSMGFDLESRHWRTLQKDIEGRIFGGGVLAVVSGFAPDVEEILT